ncbi:hypothetical protein [Streptomyces sp. NPDC007264]|uniref:hypothetical protein n=1 Tax=Streptomyces sp. NPDC007264 TaxID=3364777 RepID=UPI0036DDCA16
MAEWLRGRVRTWQSVPATERQRRWGAAATQWSWLVPRVLCLRLLVIAGAFAVLSPQAFPAHADSISDPEAVYCLSRPHRAGLVEAGVAVGVLADDSTVDALESGGERFVGDRSLEKWRTRQQGTFGTACRAFVGATALSEGNGPKEEPDSAFLTWLLPILVGSVLTMLATEMQGARTRRIAAADEVRLATAAFRDALNQYVTEWTETSTGGGPSAAPVDKQRMQLVATLRKAGLRCTRWPFVEHLVLSLDGSFYREDVKNGWHGPLAERQGKADRLRSQIARLEADTEQAASALASLVPVRLRPSRTAAPSSITNP